MSDSSSPSTPTQETVFVPEQVRRQSQRADELHREFIGETQENGVDTTGSGDEQTGGAPPVEDQQEQQRQPQPQPQTTDYEQRYRTLQGKYDSETTALRGTIASLERLLATVQAPPPAPTAPQDVAYDQSGSRPAYSQDDIDLYGEELLDAAARAAEARYATEISSLKKQVSQLSGAAEQDRVFRELDQDPELRGWRQLNTNEQFIQWLQEVDPLSGLSRNTMLQHAYQNGDAIRTGRFFKVYMAEHTGTIPSAMPPQTGLAPAPYQGNGHDPAGQARLEELAAPGRGPRGNGPGNGAPSPRLWSRSQITQFYRDRTRGAFRGREAESQALEEDLLRAEREGRIV